MAKRKTQAKPKKQYQVFLSYSHADRWIAKQFVRIIEEESKKRIKVFIDKRDMVAGDRIDDSILAAIKASDEVLVFVTHNSKDRPWVLAEITFAFAFKKRIVPVIDKVKPEEMPEMAVPIVAVDINDFDSYVEQLVKRANARMKI